MRRIGLHPASAVEYRPVSFTTGAVSTLKGDVTVLGPSPREPAGPPHVLHLQGKEYSYSNIHYIHDMPSLSTGGLLPTRFGTLDRLERGLRRRQPQNRRFTWSTPRPTTESPGSGAVAAFRRRTAAAQPPTRHRTSG